MARPVSTRLLSTALLLGLWGCNDNPPRETLPANRVIERILEHCHGARRGQFDHCTLELTAADSAMRFCSWQAPDHLRLSESRGQQVLAVEGRVWTWRSKETPIEATGQELSDLELLMALLPLLFLAPLYEGEGWQHVDAHTMVKPISSKKEWRLEYDNNLFEPIKLSGPIGEVEFLKTTSGTTRIPTRVRLDRLGKHSIKVVSAGQIFDPGIFTLPSKRQSLGRTLVFGSTLKPKVPELQKVRPSNWLIMADSKVWAERKTLYNKYGHVLHGAGQTNAGDPIFFVAGGKSFMAIPFRPKRGADPKTFTPTDDLVVRQVAAHSAAVIYAPKGNYLERVAAGEKLLVDFLAERSLAASGPLRVIVNFYSSMDPSNPQDRSRMSLRLELPVKH